MYIKIHDKMVKFISRLEDESLYSNMATTWLRI